MDDREFHVACAILEDSRKIIAAGKTQRWDVIKWAVTLNVALATASIALKQQHAGCSLFLLAVFVAVVAEGLVLHYNNRMKNARNDAVVSNEYLAKNDVNVHAITGREPKRVDWLYDWQELAFFTVILAASVAPTLVVWRILG